MSTPSLVIQFRISGASEPDDYAVRAYESARLNDIALHGPDDDGVFDAQFDREADSIPAAMQKAIADVAAVLPEAEILRVEVLNRLAGTPDR
jgi:hypothetical protein